jgi:hypothetical protein
VPTLRLRGDRPYRITASVGGLRVKLDESFWSNEVIDAQGTTRLDEHLASLVQEIRQAVYYIGTTGPSH